MQAQSKGRRSARNRRCHHEGSLSHEPLNSILMSVRISPLFPISFRKATLCSLRSIPGLLAAPRRFLQGRHQSVRHESSGELMIRNRFNGHRSCLQDGYPRALGSECDSHRHRVRASLKGEVSTLARYGLYRMVSQSHSGSFYSDLSQVPPRFSRARPTKRSLTSPLESSYAMSAQNTSLFYSIVILEWFNYSEKSQSTLGLF